MECVSPTTRRLPLSLEKEREEGGVTMEHYPPDMTYEDRERMEGDERHHPNCPAPFGLPLACQCRYLDAEDREDAAIRRWEERRDEGRDEH